MMAVAVLEVMSEGVRIVMVPVGTAADMVRVGLRQSQDQLSEVGPAADWKPRSHPPVSTTPTPGRAR